MLLLSHYDIGQGTPYSSGYSFRAGRFALLYTYSSLFMPIPGSLGSDPETIDCGAIPSRYAAILENKTLLLGGRHKITYDQDRDMLWRWDQVLKTHPNGMRFSVFGEGGDLLATNEYFRYSAYSNVSFSVG
jgi:hypothetical protein